MLHGGAAVSEERYPCNYVTDLHIIIWYRGYMGINHKCLMLSRPHVPWTRKGSASQAEPDAPGPHEVAWDVTVRKGYGTSCRFRDLGPSRTIWRSIVMWLSVGPGGLRYFRTILGLWALDHTMLGCFPIIGDSGNFVEFPPCLEPSLGHRSS